MTRLPFIVMPDVEQVVRAHLLTVPELVALVGDRISTAADPDPTYPYVVFHRNGGGEVVEFVIDRAVLDVHTYATERAEARTVAATFGAALKVARGFTHRLAVVTDVEELVGPQWLPDPERTPPTPRYVASYAVSVRPNT